MLEYLFPEVKAVLHNRGWSSDFLEIWDKCQRVCISSYFDYYFQSTLPEGAVSSKEVKRVIDLLSNEKSLTLLLRNYMFDGRISKLLPKIKYYFKDHVDRNGIQNIITALFTLGEDLPIKPESMFNISIDWIDLEIQSTVYQLLKLLDKSIRKDVLLNAMQLCENAIVFPVALAWEVWKEWDHIDEGKGKNLADDKLLNKEDAEAIKDAALELIRRHKDTDVLYKSRHLLSTIYCWEKWSNIEEVKKWVNSILSDEKKIPEFLGGCNSYISTGKTDYRFNIKLSSLEKYCDIYQLKKKCEKLLESDPEWLTDDYKNIIKAFLDSFEEVDMD